VNRVKNELENKTNKTTISTSQLSNESKSSIQSGLNELSAVRRTNTSISSQKNTVTTTSNNKLSQKQTVLTKKNIELKPQNNNNNNNITKSSVKKTTSESITCKLERENQLLIQNNESKSKEIAYLKSKLEEAHVSFEAVLTAYNYLSNELNAFEVTRLRAKLSCTKQTYEHNIDELKRQISDENKMNANLLTDLAQLKQNFDLNVQTYEKRISDLCDEHNKIIDSLHENQALLVKELKAENEENLKRHHEQLSTMKNENDTKIGQLKEQLNDANVKI
jgi:hypothetical protein